MSALKIFTDIVAVVSFCSLMIFFFINIYLIYFKVDSVLETMSKASNLRKRTALPGLYGKFMLMGEFALFVLHPKIALKSHSVTIEEINSIPFDFKKKIKILVYLEVGWLVTSALSFALIKAAPLIKSALNQ